MIYVSQKEKKNMYETNLKRMKLKNNVNYCCIIPKPFLLECGGGLIFCQITINPFYCLAFSLRFKSH